MIGGSSLASQRLTAQNIISPADYFERALEVASAACERTQSTSKCINLGGGKRAALHFSDFAIENLLFPALAHQELPPQNTEGDFKILAWDSAHSGVPMWSPPWTTADYLARGEIARYNDRRFRTVFQLDSGVLSLYDADRQVAVWWTQDYTRLPLYQRAAPFLLLFHWWHALRRDDSLLLHAAAVGTKDERGLLLSGRGGSGKSTTALACLLDGGWRYLADDYCVVQAGTETPTVHSLYCSAKIDGAALAAFPALSRRASLLPRVPRQNNGIRSNRFTPAGSGAAVRALAPSTLFQLPGAGADNFRMIVALTNRLPCFELELGSEPVVVPQSLRAFMDRLSPHGTNPN